MELHCNASQKPQPFIRRPQIYIRRNTRTLILKSNFMFGSKKKKNPPRSIFHLSVHQKSCSNETQVHPNHTRVLASFFSLRLQYFLIHKAFEMNNNNTISEYACVCVPFAQKYLESQPSQQVCEASYQALMTVRAENQKVRQVKRKKPNSKK